jgi:hypothetical protein
MKAKQDILVRLLVLHGLLLAASPQLHSQTATETLCLTAECSSNRLTLRWTGASDVKLQQATNLADPLWQDVANSEGMSSISWRR